MNRDSLHDGGEFVGNNPQWVNSRSLKDLPIEICLWRSAMVSWEFSHRKTQNSSFCDSCRRRDCSRLKFNVSETIAGRFMVLTAEATSPAEESR